jgi:hypothetical protein
MSASKRRTSRVDSFTVREWIAAFTGREPPFPAELLDRPQNMTPRRELAQITRWMEGLSDED